MELLLEFLEEDSIRAVSIIALCALVVSCLAVFWMARSIALQMRHQRLLVRPACWIAMADNGSRLKVCLQNNGAGPMIINQLIVAHGKEKRANLIDWMPPGITWETYVSSFGNRTLASGHELCVLDLRGDPAEPQFRIQRDSVRSQLARLTVTVKYRDIYGKRMPRFQRKLQWFGRNEDRLD